MDAFLQNKLLHLEIFKKKIIKLMFGSPQEHEFYMGKTH